MSPPDPIPPAVIERNQIVAWLLAFRAGARNRIADPERLGTTEAVLAVIIEQIAAGAHLDHAAATARREPPVFH